MPEPVTPPAADPAAPPPPPEPKPAADPIAREMADLRTRLAAYDTKEAARTETARQAELQKLVDKGKLEEVVAANARELAARDSKYETLLKATRQTELSRSLTAALAGKPLVPGAAAQLAELWAKHFEVIDGPDGTFHVRSTDLKTPDLFVAERLASPDYAHFVTAAGRGGAGGAGGAAATPDPNAQPTVYKTYEEFVNARWNSEQSKIAAGPSWQRGWKDQLVKKAGA